MSEISIEESLFGRLSNKQEVKKYTLTNKNGFSFSVISYGASIQSINVKDKDGKLRSVALGLNTLEEYTNPVMNPYLGASVGRVANRISNAEFKLDGVVHKLEKNNGNHCLHGGSRGFGKKNWISSIIDNFVKFSYVSADADGGFPGEVWIEAIYKLDNNENKITIEYKAITDKPTPIDLTNHVYLNLNGHNSGCKIYNHELKLNADKYLDFNPNEVTVTGRINSVENTKYDFRNFTSLSDRIKSEANWPDNGFDSYFVANHNGLIASVKNPSNGLRLDVETNQLGVQFYTGNFMNSPYGIHDGFCLETHNYPDSVNHVIQSLIFNESSRNQFYFRFETRKEKFPSCILGTNEEYLNKTCFTFSIEN